FIETNATAPSISKHLQESYIFKKDDGHPEIVDENSDFPVKTLCASYHKIQRITGTFVRGGDTGLRLLTANECKAIQGFPLDFKVPVSRTQMYHQFGNSVAVPVIQAVAQEIINTIPREFLGA
ncbi:DNA cytosine methyltransferase, partial [Treponema sp. JC4]|uniref:DNA cytosine methyltransferase n=1 Tax=Treponema sp. JC4 TaxID=1124982 RepID=UPI0005879239